MFAVPSWLPRPRSRVTAFAAHLALSTLVFSLLVVVMLIYWFPGDLFFMDGGWQGLKLVAIVDLVLGPLLMLVLFKPGKPGLKFDMSMIAAFQITALALGFYTTYNQRTVAIVFADNEFATVSAKDIKEANDMLLAVNGTPKPLPKAEAFKVPLLMTPDPENFGIYLENLFNGYPGAHMRSDQHVALASNHAQLQRKQKTTVELEQLGLLTTVQKVANTQELSIDDVEVYNFRARYAGGFAVYEPESARIIDFIDSSAKIKNGEFAENDS